MANERNALAELAEKLGNVFCEYAEDTHIVEKAQRIIAELANHNVNLIPQECYGCGVLKTLSKCRAIAAEGGAE